MLLENEPYLSEEKVDAIIDHYKEPTGDLLSMLEELQDNIPSNYLPREALKRVAQKTGTSLSQIFSVVTFYSFFNLEPQGKHCIMVCRGTACHTRGSRNLLDSIRDEVDIAADEDSDAEFEFTTEDHELTVRTVACFGQCALAPVIARDEDIYGYVSDARMREIVRDIKQS